MIKEIGDDPMFLHDQSEVELMPVCNDSFGEKQIVMYKALIDRNKLRHILEKLSAIRFDKKRIAYCEDLVVSLHHELLDAIDFKKCSREDKEILSNIYFCILNKLAEVAFGEDCSVKEKREVDEMFVFIRDMFPEMSEVQFNRKDILSRMSDKLSKMRFDEARCPIDEDDNFITLCCMKHLLSAMGFDKKPCKGEEKEILLGIYLNKLAEVAFSEKCSVREKRAVEEMYYFFIFISDVPEAQFNRKDILSRMSDKLSKMRFDEARCPIDEDDNFITLCCMKHLLSAFDKKQRKVEEMKIFLGIYLNKLYEIAFSEKCSVREKREFNEMQIFIGDLLPEIPEAQFNRKDILSRMSDKLSKMRSCSMDYEDYSIAFFSMKRLLSAIRFDQKPCTVEEKKILWCICNSLNDICQMPPEGIPRYYFLEGIECIPIVCDILRKRCVVGEEAAHEHQSSDMLGMPIAKAEGQPCGNTGFFQQAQQRELENEQPGASPQGKKP